MPSSKKINWHSDYARFVVGLTILYLAYVGFAVWFHYNNPRNIIHYTEGQ